MYNMTIFEKIYFWPLFVTFEVTALVENDVFWKIQMNFVYLYTEATLELQKLGKL